MPKVDYAAVDVAIQGEGIVDILNRGDSASDHGIALARQGIELGLSSQCEEVYDIVTANARVADKENVLRRRPDGGCAAGGGGARRQVAYWAGRLIERRWKYAGPCIRLKSLRLYPRSEPSAAIGVA